MSATAPWPTNGMLFFLVTFSDGLKPRLKLDLEIQRCCKAFSPTLKARLHPRELTACNLFLSDILRNKDGLQKKSKKKYLRPPTETISPTSVMMPRRRRRRSCFREVGFMVS